jgi:phosphoribosyl-ATP pyrophosphohydrolase/phosphoribosyl-AMP cyclohydrolase
LPITIAPAARSRRTTSASAAAGGGCWRVPISVRSPATCTLSFTATGTPKSGRSPPAPRRLSACFASASARSPNTTRNAFSAGSRRAIRVRHSSTSSTGETSPARTSSAWRAIPAKARSSSVTERSLCAHTIGPVLDPQTIAFDERGLVPCIVQDWRTGEVLTLAYMNRDALDRTQASGETWFWSRSRSELWHKGATSGNVQTVRELRYDCDADALLALVEPAGPACHTGERTCFHNGELEPPAPHEALPALERTIAERAAAADTTKSYTATLLADRALAGAKVEEEAEEVVRAVREESDERVREEAADVLYHLDVLLAARGVSLTEAFEVLNGRRR